MDQKKIGKYIADKRKALGMTQVSLADKLDISDKSVSKWERGVCLPDVSKYQELCDTLGISLNELFAGEDLPAENVIKQSERNLLWISRLGEVKNKRLFRIIIALIMCVIVLTAGFIWNMNQDKTLRGNYITAFSIENPDEAGLVFTFGDAAIFNYSLDESFENVTYEIVKYNNGKITDTLIKKTPLPDGRRQEDMIGIQDAIQDDKIRFINTMDGGSIGNSIPVNVTEDEKMMGYSYATLEKPAKVEKGEKILIYARLAGDIVYSYPLNEIAENPEEYLDEMECCILIYLTFE
ncbi:MAG: helix-turn-helix domain-containing protein [Clostridiales bacterium]|nr:helix-turn-helix domain-containing protein [Clostridiales bacterium]